MGRMRGWIFLAVALTCALPAPARAQGWAAAAIGGGLGLGAGGFVSLGIVTLDARRGQYVYGVDDVLGWRSVPVLAGAATGVVLGAWQEQRLRHTVYGTIGGGALGAGIGALLGRELWAPPEGKWAGAVIGGAAGILLGAGIGMLWPIDGGGANAPAAPVTLTLQLPLAR